MVKTYTTTVETTVDEDALSTLISTATYNNCGFDWWSYDDKEYEEAKSELISERKPDADDQICVEDVLARLLLRGGKLNLLEAESGWHWPGHEPGEMLKFHQYFMEGLEPVGGTWHKVGIEDIVRGIQLYAASGYANACGADIKRINEYGDFLDADAVFQFAAYGEVIING